MDAMQVFYNRLVVASETDPYRRLMKANPEDMPTGGLLPWLDW
jgi:hypothetical protein